MDDKKDDEGAPIVSLDDARKEKAAAGQPIKLEGVDAASFLQPVMAAIAKELAGLAGPDGVVRLGGDDEASKAKTQAVVRGLGIGLGAAIAEAFGKLATKVDIKTEDKTAPSTPSDPAEPDPNKPKS
jgi:hypothetical protein